MDHNHSTPLEATCKPSVSDEPAELKWKWPTNRQVRQCAPFPVWPVPDARTEEQRKADFVAELAEMTTERAMLADAVRHLLVPTPIYTAAEMREELALEFSLQDREQGRSNPDAAGS